MSEEEENIEIARMGHPVLMGVAKEVIDIQSKEVQEVIDDMITAHLQQGGVGIAAPQIFIPLRIVIVQVTPLCALSNGIPETPMMILINPVMEVLDESKQVDWEGCLSVPGMYGEVPRATKVSYTAYDREGHAVKGVLEGYIARILQHEMDHINGVLYPMRVEDLKRFGYLDEVREFLLG